MVWYQPLVAQTRIERVYRVYEALILPLDDRALSKARKFLCITNYANSASAQYRNRTDDIKISLKSLLNVP